MPAKATCPKCDSDRWMSNLWILSGMTIAVEPPSLLREASGASDVRARACGICGYVEFYASTPNHVWEERCRKERAAAAARRPNLPVPAAGADAESNVLPRPSSADQWG